MKKILERGSINFFFLEDPNDSIGYVVLVENYKPVFEHVMCCWGGPPSKELSSAVAENRGDLKKIILCSRDGKGDYEQFGVDTCLRCLDDAESEQVKKRVTDLFSSDLEELREQDERTRAEKVQEELVCRRTKEVGKLLKEMRYQDARDHCQLYGLDYERILSDWKAVAN